MPIGTVGSDGILRRTDLPDTYRGPETAPSFLSPRLQVGGGNAAADEAAAWAERAERLRAERAERERQRVGRKRSPLLASTLAAVRAGAERKRREELAARREAEFQAAWAARCAAMRNENR